MVSRGRPPHPFEPIVETVPAGTILYRVHEPVFPSGAANDGSVMNPGLGKPTRFAFFGDPVVPVLYAADRPEGAVHESILHDAAPRTFIPRAQWRSKVLSVLEVTSDLVVAAFHSDGLRRFGLYPSDLTDSGPSTYPRTVLWAEAAWDAGLDGVSYMCRHYNTSKALCLFGGRRASTGLRATTGHTESRAFLLPSDAEWLASLAWEMKVVIRP